MRFGLSDRELGEDFEQKGTGSDLSFTNYPQLPWGAGLLGGRVRDGRRLEGRPGLCPSGQRLGVRPPLFQAYIIHFKSLYSRGLWFLLKPPDPPPSLGPGLRDTDGLMQGFDSSDPQ